MGFAGEQYVFGAAGEVGLVLLGERGQGEGVPADGVGIAIACFQLAADGCYPDQMQARGDEGKVPEGRIVKGEVAVSCNTVIC